MTSSGSSPAVPLCFVGYMAGSRPGFTTSQGFVLSQILRGMGWPVGAVSSRHDRLLRLIDISAFLLANGRNYGVIVMEVYGGRNFLLVDIASMVAMWTRRPIVMVLHGGSLPSLMGRYPRWTGRVLRRAQALVAPSRFLARAADDILNLSAEVIPNVIDVLRYPFRLRANVRPNLLWMRAFHDLYNPAMAIRVFERVRAKYPDARLTMAGKDVGGMEAARSLAAAKGLSGSITFPGFIDFEAKIRAFEESDIFINTSRIDNMPVSLVEACAAGLPIVSTSVGGVPDLITHERHGLLVDDDDDRAMAEAIFRLLEEPGLGERLSVNGRELALASSREAVIPQWESLFARCTGTRP